MDPVEQAEIEHDQEQDALQGLFDLLQSALKEAALIKFGAELESKASRLDFLGFEDFKPFFPESDEMPLNTHFKNKTLIQFVECLFATSIMNKDWVTAAAIVISRASTVEMEDDLLNAVNAKDRPAVEDIISTRCQKQLDYIQGRVDAEWWLYE